MLIFIAKGIFWITNYYGLLKNIDPMLLNMHYVFKNVWNDCNETSDTITIFHIQQLKDKNLNFAP
jgi:hypothetical protein